MTSEISRAERKRKLQEELASIEKDESIDAARELLGEDYMPYFNYSEAQLLSLIDDAKKHIDSLVKIHDVVYKSDEQSKKKRGGFRFRANDTNDKRFIRI